MMIILVCLSIPVAFGIWGIVSDYLFPRIPWIERALETLPLWEEDDA